MATRFLTTNPRSS